jgi:hypothetical protein
VTDAVPPRLRLRGPVATRSFGVKGKNGAAVGSVAGLVDFAGDETGRAGLAVAIDVDPIIGTVAMRLAQKTKRESRPGFTCRASVAMPAMPSGRECTPDAEKRRMVHAGSCLGLDAVSRAEDSTVWARAR